MACEVSAECRGDGIGEGGGGDMLEECAGVALGSD
jgi:hypothetical protein